MLEHCQHLLALYKFLLVHRTKHQQSPNSNTDGTYIALGHTDGKLKIIDPFNRFILIRPFNGNNQTNIVKLQCGDDHTCLMYQDLIEQRYNIICWGDNTYGQCDWPALQEERYTLLFPENDISEMWSGGYHNCITKVNNIITEDTKRQKSPMCWANPDLKPIYQTQM